MAYQPSRPNKFPPNMRGNDLGWTRVLSNHNEVYDLYRPAVVQAGSSEADPLVTLDTADLSLTSSFADAIRFVVPRNLDDVTIAVAVTWRAAGNAEIRAVCGSDVNDDGIPSFSGWGTSTLWVSPADATAGADPLLGREVTIQFRDGSGGANTIEVLSVVAYLDPSPIPSGVQPSGWISVPDLADAPNQPIPSERVARLMSGPAQILGDRPPTVATVIQSSVAATRGGGRYRSSSTSWTTVARVIITGPVQGPPILYGVAAYLSSGGDVDPQLSITNPNIQTVSLSGNGWQFGSFTAPSGAMTDLAVRLRTSDGSMAALHTLQIFRLGPEVT